MWRSNSVFDETLERALPGSVSSTHMPVKPPDSDTSMMVLQDIILDDSTPPGPNAWLRRSSSLIKYKLKKTSSGESKYSAFSQTVLPRILSPIANSRKVSGQSSAQDAISYNTQLSTKSNTTQGSSSEASTSGSGCPRCGASGVALVPFHRRSVASQGTTSGSNSIAPSDLFFRQGSLVPEEVEPHHPSLLISGREREGSSQSSADSGVGLHKPTLRLYRCGRVQPTKEESESVSTGSPVSPRSMQSRTSSSTSFSMAAMERQEATDQNSEVFSDVEYGTDVALPLSPQLSPESEHSVPTGTFSPAQQCHGTQMHMQLSPHSCTLAHRPRLPRPSLASEAGEVSHVFLSTSASTTSFYSSPLFEYEGYVAEQPDGAPVLDFVEWLAIRTKEAAGSEPRPSTDQFGTSSHAKLSQISPLPSPCNSGGYGEDRGSMTVDIPAYENVSHPKRKMLGGLLRSPKQPCWSAPDSLQQYKSLPDDQAKKPPHRLPSDTALNLHFRRAKQSDETSWSNHAINDAIRQDLTVNLQYIPAGTRCDEIDAYVAHQPPKCRAPPSPLKGIGISKVLSSSSLSDSCRKRARHAQAKKSLSLPFCEDNSTYTAPRSPFRATLPKKKKEKGEKWNLASLYRKVHSTPSVGSVDANKTKTRLPSAQRMLRPHETVDDEIIEDLSDVFEGTPEMHLSMERKLI